MSVNGAIETFEIERKYEVALEAVLPDGETFSTIGLRSGAAELYELRASYFDTPEGHLAAQRIAVRRRSGGKDAGWHMKFKGEKGVRELQWPVSKDVPEGLLKEVADRLSIKAAARLTPIATIDTQRMTLLLIDAHDQPVIELADDRVEAHNVLSGRRQQWREWEAEVLGSAQESILDSLEPLLLAVGAERVRGSSKIQRTMSEEA